MADFGETNILRSTPSDREAIFMKAFVLVFSFAGALSANAALAYDPQGSGKISNGNCTCKGICNQFAKSGQLAGPKLAQCKSDCEQKYSGCNKGATR